MAWKWTISSSKVKIPNEENVWRKRMAGEERVSEGDARGATEENRNQALGWQNQAEGWWLGRFDVYLIYLGDSALLMQMAADRETSYDDPS